MAEQEAPQSRREYLRWRGRPGLDETLQEELRLMEGDAQKIEACFGRSLAFGTGGLRGVLGAGTDRMNIYTVARATQGLADHLRESAGTGVSVVIAYDSRRNGRRFAETAARVLAANGLKAWLFTRLGPTPLLSFAVRRLGCAAGICVTASHNPADYNGYKVYGADGCQITLAAARAIQAHIDAVDVLEGPKMMELERARAEGRIQDVPQTVWDRYIDSVAALAEPLQVAERAPLRVVYTPLNGAGRECVLRILERIGAVEVTEVPSQELPDGDFPTCPYPNPEEPSALTEGLKLCRTLEPDLLLATDPDCDRIGVVSKERTGYRTLSGNETGMLLFDFLCRSRIAAGTMPLKPVAVTTIVSTDMADPIAAEYGVELRRTLTGFKYIGEQIGLLEAAGETERFLFGFEESCGYLSGTHARDKDAVNAVLLIALMAGWYKARGVTLGQAMDGLYERYGCFRTGLLSFSPKGAQAMERMGRLMRTLRAAPPQQLGNTAVARVKDYLSGIDGLPASDVLSLTMEDGSRAVIRPSGTEPKIKAYLFVRASGPAEADAGMERLRRAVEDLIQAGLEN